MSFRPPELVRHGRTIRSVGHIDQTGTHKPSGQHSHAVPISPGDTNIGVVDTARRYLRGRDSQHQSDQQQQDYEHQRSIRVRGSGGPIELLAFRSARSSDGGTIAQIGRTRIDEPLQGGDYVLQGGTAN